MVQPWHPDEFQSAMAFIPTRQKQIEDLFAK